MAVFQTQQAIPCFDTIYLNRAHQIKTMPELPDLRAPAQEQDTAWMRIALEQARLSAQQGEVPVGAVLVRGQTPQRLLACTHNQPVGLSDPTAHAEVLALRQAAKQLGNYRLEDCDLYVTLEPCAMCAQALLHARVRRVIFGAQEPKTGAAGSVLNLFALEALNHQTQVTGGVLADECAALMQDFFKSRRAAAKAAALPLREDALRSPNLTFDPIWSVAADAWPGRFFIHALPALQGLRMAGVRLPGDSEPAVLGLHGPQGWWPELIHWARSASSIGHQVILPDLIGFGMSDKPKRASWHRLETHALSLWQLLDAHSIEKVMLAYAPGQSALARVFQALHPGRVLNAQALTPQDLLTTGLPADWRSLPFPDKGHQAALRAWRTHGWLNDAEAGE